MYIPTPNATAEQREAVQEYEYLMYITCKATGENITEIYGDGIKTLKDMFHADFGESYCDFEIFINKED